MINSSDGDTNDISEPAKKRMKKMLTRERLVGNLEQSLNENNYDNFLISSVGATYSVTMIKATKNVPAKKITWTKRAPEQGGRQGRENIIRTKGGPINGSDNADSVFDIWKLFMTSEMLESIVTFTNIQIERC